MLEMYVNLLPEKIAKNSVTWMKIQHSEKIRVKVRNKNKSRTKILTQTEGAILSYIMTMDHGSVRSMSKAIYGINYEKTSIKTHISEINKKFGEEFRVISGSVLEEYLFYGTKTFELNGVEYNPFERKISKDSRSVALSDQAGIVMEYITEQKGKILSFDDIQDFAVKRIGKRLKNIGVLVSEVMREFNYVTRSEYIYRTSEYAERIVIGKLKPKGIKFGDYRYDEKDGIIYKLNEDNTPVFLTENENIVMKALIKSKYEPITTDELKLTLFGRIKGVNAARYIKSIKEKTGDNHTKQEFIKTVGNGEGYMLRVFYDKLNHS